MGFVSYSEDILKRYESDIRDLFVDLESGNIVEGRQNKAIPEFRALVERLRELLSDPSHPVAMRFLDVRAENRELDQQLKKSQRHNLELACKNNELNSINLRLKREVEGLQKKSIEAEREVRKATAQIADLQSAVEALEREVLKALVTK